MTSFFQSISRSPFASLSIAGCGAAFTAASQDAGTGEAEYHLVFATTAAALITGVAVVFAALTHAF